MSTFPKKGFSYLETNLQKKALIRVNSYGKIIEFNDIFKNSFNLFFQSIQNLEGSSVFGLINISKKDLIKFIKHCKNIRSDKSNIDSEKNISIYNKDTGSAILGVTLIEVSACKVDHLDIFLLSVSTPKVLKTGSCPILRKAFQANLFEVYLQPIHCNKTNEISKYETLVRIEDSNLFYTPSYFMKNSKKDHSYAAINSIVLEKSIETIIKHNVTLSVNLSIGLLNNEKISMLINDFILNNPRNAKNLIVEILEDEVEITAASATFINKIRKYGIRIAVDDFGSKFSNTSRLYKIQPDIIKFDGEFIKECINSSFSRDLLIAYVDFCTKKSIETVAEYVENASIYQLVKNAGVQYSQGYYFSKPKKISSYLS